MRTLTIYSTYSCPFKCYFCYNKEKCNDSTLIDIEKVDIFLSKYSKLFDKVVISGGETTLQASSFIQELVDTVKKYIDNIEISSYPINNSVLLDDVKYNISYDFIARPRVRESWIKLLQLNREFDMTITLAPLVFKYYPNKILSTLTMLKGLKTVTFKPFYNNINYRYPIKQSDYQKFMDIVKQSKLNLPFTVNYGEFNDEFVLTPYNELKVVQFDKDENRYEQLINEEDIEKYTTNYPESVKIC